MQCIAGTLGILCAVMFLAGAAEAKDALILKSTSIDLPTGDRQFTGAGADVVNDNCLTCHSAGMILVQPPLPKATWDGIVKKMINVYKAPVRDQDVAAIVEYLSNHPAGSK
ncbi:cytochrome c [Hyphomicrobium sp.]|jgi:mono/diheme cytochrome c family protein|uniref:c-type cytochrome n=1 Tax=Hyphomicrobium sp. TaxID=82 RepID=UPI00356602A0